MGTFGAGAGAAPLFGTSRAAAAAVEVLATGAVVGSADMVFEREIASEERGQREIPEMS